MAINIHEIIGNALLEMCKTRPLASITVKEILDETGVSRQAFYNRFRDKNDLIQWVYEHKVLSEFLKSGRASSYYLNTLNFYRAINVYRDFMRQACRMEGQNCLMDFIYAYATDYDLKWHQYYYGPSSARLGVCLPISLRCLYLHTSGLDPLRQSGIPGGHGQTNHLHPEDQLQ